MNSFDTRYMQLQCEKLNKILRKKQSVSSVSIELDVSRKTVYQWLRRYQQYGVDGLRKKKRKTYPVAHNRTEEYIEKIVIFLAKKYYTEGVVSLADILYVEYKISLNPSTIYRILKRNDIRYGTYHIHTHKRWKKKLYAHKIPGTELQMDTMYPFGYKAGKVVYTIIDDASRWSYVKTYDTSNANNTIDFLKNVLQRAYFDIHKIRTDNGTEFINDKTKNFLENNHIVHRKNTPGCPEQNGKIERFHQTLKRAFKYRIPFDSTIDDTQYHLALFMQYYNNQKRHRGIGMMGMTPMQKLEECKSVTLTLQCHNN